MRTGARANSLAAAACLGGALFASMGAGVSPSPPAIDRTAFDLLATTRGSALARGMRLLADVGPDVAAALVLDVVVLPVTRRRWLEAVVSVGGFALVAVAVHVPKSVVARPRPQGAPIVAGGHSFPSTEAALSIGLLAIAAAWAVRGPGGSRPSSPWR